ncbi:unnamed protein product [Somion occarium]|uniref:Uncharacterized protein n=1 Tax=Somion occarium TaxID=3059160 RepID=A0ABP1DSD7_9APHY
MLNETTDTSLSPLLDGRTRYVGQQWLRDPNGPLISKPPPCGVRTPNGIIWGHDLKDFMWIQRIPNADIFTIWSRSMVKEFGENYVADEWEHEDERQLPRCRFPWPVLKLPKKIMDLGLHGTRIGIIDEGCDKHRHPDYVPKYRQDVNEYSASISEPSSAQRNPAVDAVRQRLFPMMVDSEKVFVANDEKNPLISSLGFPYTLLWAPEIRESIALVRGSVRNNTPLNVLYDTSGFPMGMAVGQPVLSEYDDVGLILDAVGVVELPHSSKGSTMENTEDADIEGETECSAPLADHPADDLSALCANSTFSRVPTTDSFPDVPIPSAGEAPMEVDALDETAHSGGHEVTTSSDVDVPVEAQPPSEVSTTGTLELPQAEAPQNTESPEDGSATATLAKVDLDSNPNDLTPFSEMIDLFSSRPVDVPRPIDSGDANSDNSQPWLIISDKVSQSATDSSEAPSDGDTVLTRNADAAAANPQTTLQQTSAGVSETPPTSNDNVPASASTAEEYPPASRKPPYDSPYSVKDIPKLEEFIPTAFFPDILIVHDPHHVTLDCKNSDAHERGMDDNDVPFERTKRYVRMLPKLPGEARAENPVTKKPEDSPRVAHLYLHKQNTLGAGHHSDVYRAPLTLPPPLSAHSRNGNVVVAAKTSLARRSARELLQNEGLIYSKFPKHLMEDWCGYNIVAPIKHPVPVGPVVPKFYGYYLPEGVSSSGALDNSTASPILLLEECGEPVQPSKFTLDDRSECYSLMLRLHLANFVQGSSYVRNIVVQPGPLTAPPEKRSKKTPSFRIIDFGRGDTWATFVGTNPDQERKERKVREWWTYINDEDKKAQDELRVEEFVF